MNVIVLWISLCVQCIALVSIISTALDWDLLYFCLSLTQKWRIDLCFYLVHISNWLLFLELYKESIGCQESQIITYHISPIVHSQSEPKDMWIGIVLLDILPIRQPYQMPLKLFLVRRIIFRMCCLPPSPLFVVFVFPLILEENITCWPSLTALNL